MSDERETTAAGEAEEPPRTRQELWQRIRASSRDEFILEEMIRLGFWPDETKKPSAPAKMIHRIGELEREVRALATEKARIADRDAMLREIRKRRLAEARQKRKETKERRERERRERAAAWRERKGEEILYLGEGVSAGLGRRESDPDRLARAGLARLDSAADVARAMDVSLGELRFLAFHRAVSRTTHYRRFEIPKRTGGHRLISAPMPRLKEAQRWLLENVLDPAGANGPWGVHEKAHGFLHERSILTNAAPHVGRDLVVNCDLKDFFPTVTYRRVKGLYRALGYSEEVATIFALLATEPRVDEVELDGDVYYVHSGERHLPQGSPASPAITNLLCRRLDRHLDGLAVSLGYTYTRYADDLTFSADGEATSQVGSLLRTVSQVVAYEGFALHPDKTRIMRRGRRQEVTGLTVNDRLGVDRKTLRRFRAVLYQIEKDGPEGKSWNGVGAHRSGDVMASVLGYAGFVRMVDPEKGGPLVERVRAILDKTGYTLPSPPVYPERVPSWKLPKETEKGAEAGEAPKPDRQEPESKKPWWKFW